MANTRINNKSRRTIHLTLPGNKGSIMLPPGFTEVDTEKFQSTLKAKSEGANGEMFSVVEKMREEGDLDWEGDGGSPREAKQLSSMGTQDALRVIKETFARDQLDAYAKEDQRPEVQKAITDQREQVAKSNKEGVGDAGSVPEGAIVAPTGDQPSAADVATLRSKPVRK